jgi:hypothetical protein
MSFNRFQSILSIPTQALSAAVKMVTRYEIAGCELRRMR